MFSSDDLAGMRATQTSAMPDLGVLKRRVMESDGFGGHTTASLTTVASNVPCRVTPAQVQAMGGQADRALELEKYTLRFPYGTDVRDRDLFVWEGQTIEIEDVKAPRSYGTVVTASGERVK